MDMEYRITSISLYIKGFGKTVNFTVKESFLGLMVHLTRASIKQVKSMGQENLLINPKKFIKGSGPMANNREMEFY